MDINDYKKFRVKMERLWELAVFEYSKLREDKKLVDRNIEVKLDEELRTDTYNVCFRKRKSFKF